MILPTDLYQSDAFRLAISECQLFRLKYPQGGQCNDGFALLGELTFVDGAALLKALDTLQVTYHIHREKPPIWSPPPLTVDAEQIWITYARSCVCLGYQTQIKINTSIPSLEFNFNAKSWYEVTLDDVKRAVSFEKMLRSLGLL
ncbi:hypothetical protein VST7929_01886 [Vibrio stylophorae]|uniref:Uncharacterized protein n=1 Tax=Vibrio stylophorae TaxID=659351 RepID=A0ABM8ZUL2_9VIBR|nr:hypothetical protein [Vibrio stylophorae]CAH0534004.1 hypothetical protein VST7929_01886 [Vibrio stylophorae]